MGVKSAFIRARIEPKLKHKVESMFEKMGFTTTQALTLFYKQVEKNKRLPCDYCGTYFHIPNEETYKTIKEVNAQLGLTKCENEDDLFNKLAI